MFSSHQHVAVIHLWTRCGLCPPPNPNHRQAPQGYRVSWERGKGAAEIGNVGIWAHCSRGLLMPLYVFTPSHKYTTVDCHCAHPRVLMT